ncbi:rRNA methyltransferase 3, mitochondrial isoform X3 [Coturnix japonica]|uniref:rRNA methyltransferase 3, mitochondrial isoform X3 n=2 Tax=Coturnix japonica TaxID=93934 RepID=UPI0013A5E49D|nr:rRNA methyltransferase 3, mitochondrial isoform X3 [Coturnix japonica]
MAALSRVVPLLLRALAGPGGETPGRRWVRALRRSPVRVLPPRKERVEAQQKPVEHHPPQPAVERGSAGPGLWYEKASPGDKSLGKVVTIAKSRSFRDRHGKVLLEGHRLIRDALEAGAVPRALFFSTALHLRELPPAPLKGARLVRVRFEDIKCWSDVVAPQGMKICLWLLAALSMCQTQHQSTAPFHRTCWIFSKPDHTKMSYPTAQLPIILICDNIRDPGNLGTILRSAAGAGCEKVLLTKGCVDPWEPKVLRAGMGAHFRVPIVANLDWESVPSNLPSGVRVCVADNKDQGIQAETEPTSQRAGRSGSHSGNPKAPVKAKHKAAPPEYEDEEGTEGICSSELAAQCYYENWIQSPAAVVVGGETHGLSPDALHLAARTGGKRLVIPVVPGVDSLNSAVAAAIVLFEGKRQLQQRRHKQEDERQKFPLVG